MGTGRLGLLKGIHDGDCAAEADVCVPQIKCHVAGRGTTTIEFFLDLQNGEVKAQTLLEDLLDTSSSSA